MSKSSNAIRAGALALLTALVGIVPATPAGADDPQPTVAHAPSKQTDHETNAWGTFPGGASIEVWTEVRLGDGSWSPSRTGVTDAEGRFVLPLTYGLGRTGDFEYRIGGRYADGRVAYSEPFVMTRLPRPSAASAGERHVSITSNTWGNVRADGADRVWTEVRLDDGTWSRSQVREANDSGRFVIPLTYGANNRGDYQYRVAAEYEDGTVTRSTPFELTRFGGSVTAASAGEKPVGQASNAWGTFLDGAGIPVWTEVRLPNGTWSKSQSATANGSGYFVLPLTYGQGAEGTYTYRVAGRYADGHVAHSDPFTITRTKPALSGTKYDWMRAAGIPESQWTYADYIVTRESGWNPNARNRSSGACGLAQALPCSKVGGNWNDPVTSLKWQYNYVNDRYGGYQGAYNFWQRNHWY